MLGNYLPVLIFLIIASALAVIMLGLGSLLGRLSTRAKSDP